ncbi:MAG: methionyl-tRNA formyltransferase [Persicimonas sp.]
MPNADDPVPLRVVYMGTPDFAVPALEALIDSHHEVVGVFTQPDRKSGRGKKVRKPPVKKTAEAADVPVYQPETLQGGHALEQLVDFQPDVVVVAAYGQILPEAFLEVPPYGCLNIHASLLPKYRGAAPINWAIVRGEDKTGVTIMQMDAGLDTGPILATHEIDLPADMTAQQLHDRLADLGGDVIVEALDQLEAGELDPTPQDDDEASWAPMLSKEDGRIDWEADANDVANHIRGFNPWPGAFAYHEQDGEKTRIKFHVAEPTDGAGEPGEVLEADASAGRLVIACGDGAIAVGEIQAPGRKAMRAGDFLNGYGVCEGDFFV